MTCWPRPGTPVGCWWPTRAGMTAGSAKASSPRSSKAASPGRSCGRRAGTASSRSDRPPGRCCSGRTTSKRPPSPWPRRGVEMTGVRPLDLLEVDHLLSDDERDIQRAVREFVDHRVRPNVASWYEHAAPDLGVLREAGSLGLLGMHLEGYGCAGTNAVSYGLACLE